MPSSDPKRVDSMIDINYTNFLVILVDLRHHVTWIIARPTSIRKVINSLAEHMTFVTENPSVMANHQKFISLRNYNIQHTHRSIHLTSKPKYNTGNLYIIEIRRRRSRIDQHEEIASVFYNWDMRSTSSGSADIPWFLAIPNGICLFSSWPSFFCQFKIRFALPWNVKYDRAVQ